MPGLAGWIGGDPHADFLPEAAIQGLRNEPFHTVEVFPNVRDGRIFLTHTAATLTSHGIFSDPGSQRVVAFWGEFYGPEFAACQNGQDVARRLSELLAEPGAPGKALDALDGSFVLYSQTADGQLFATDRTASRPLYYGVFNGALVVAPELKFFRQLPAGRPPLHADALVSFLVNGHPIADSTYFEGVRLLPPGSLLHKTSGGAAVVRYANYVPASETAPDLGAAVYRDELAARLRQAIARRCDGLASAIVPISGGYDSRGLLACIREVYSGPLQTVSWGTSEDDPDADASIGRRVAAFYGTEHTFLRREAGHLIDDLERETLRIDAANDDPFLHHAEPAIIRHLRCDLHRTILFRGDECFGYGPPAESAYEAMGRVNVYELAQFPDLQALLRKDFLPRALESQHATIAGILERAPRFSDWSNLKDWLYIEQRLARSLNFSQYVKLSYLEARNPWLDRNVLSFFAGLPLHYRYEKSLYRETLRGMFPKVMQEIPIATRNSLENWGPVLRSPAFLNFARAHLVESRSVLHDFFDSAAISALLDRFESGAQVRSRSVSLIEIPRDLLRRYANPVYRLLKRNSAGLARRSQPAEWTIGRLLILKLWCDSLI